MPKGPHCRVCFEKQCTGNEKISGMFSQDHQTVFCQFAVYKTSRQHHAKKDVNAKACSLNLTVCVSFAPSIALIRYTKLCRNLHHSSPVNRLENASGFPFPSLNHLTTIFAKRERLASIFRLVISLKKGEFVLNF